MMEVFVVTKNNEYKMNAITDIYCKRSAENRLGLCVSGYDALTHWEMTRTIPGVIRINEYYGPGCSCCDVHEIKSEGDLLTVANRIAFRLALDGV